MISFERPPRCHVSEAERPEHWAAAALLVRELIDWMTAETGVKPEEVQAGAARELSAMATFYARPSGRFFVGYVDGQASGTLGVRLLGERTAELKRMWVTPTARGHHLAARLLDHAIEEATSMGVERIRLETEATLMAKAVAMYRSRGFSEIAPYSDLVKVVPTLLSMEKPLAA